MSDETAGSSVQISVNGKPMSVPRGTTIAALLVLLGIEKTRVAVERNKDVVTKQSYEETTLGAGDHVEVVSFVGGG